MDLNYLLFTRGIDTKTSRVLVMRHTPTEPQLRRRLPRLAAERPDLFNAYQRGQNPAVEKQLMGADYLASFIGRRAGQGLFVGLYKVAGQRRLAFKDLWGLPANRELQKLGMKAGGRSGHRSSALWFDLRLTDVCADWKGKLIISWPPPEIRYARWANKNEFKVKAILEESALDERMPPWDKLVLTWEDLRTLPKSWVSTLSEWRGVYLILDGADGKGYVGSAYGDKGDKKNIYGRWSDYAAKGDGGNKRLRERAPDRFLFSILELVSPTARPEDVIERENTWKDRLHTREFGLNAN
jgi:hypothetical protein